MPAGTAVVAAIIFIILALVLLIASKQLLVRATARRLHTYRTTVVNMTTETTIAYVGVFIPIETNNLVIEGGEKIKVDKTVFRATRIGESVMVSEYSDGSHRLETRMPQFKIGL